MKFSEDDKVAKFLIDSYGDNSLTIQGETYTDSIILSPNDGPVTWNIENPQQLQPLDLAPLLRLNPEVLLIGQGDSFKATDSGLIATLIQAQVGYEFMTAEAACRSYNLLANDYRRVVLGLVRGS